MRDYFKSRFTRHHNLLTGAVPITGPIVDNGRTAGKKVGRKVAAGASGPVLEVAGFNGSAPAGTTPLTATFSAAPNSGDLLIAVCHSYTLSPSLQAGWTSFRASAAATFNPAAFAAYKYCGAGEAAAQTPYNSTGASGYGLTIWRIVGVNPTWAGALVNDTLVRNGGTSISGSRTTSADNRLSLVMAFGQNATNLSAFPAPAFSAGSYTEGFAGTNGADNVRRCATIAGHLECPASGTVQDVTANWTVSAQGSSLQLITLALA